MFLEEKSIQQLFKLEPWRRLVFLPPIITFIITWTRTTHTNICITHIPAGPDMSQFDNYTHTNTQLLQLKPLDVVWNKPGSMLAYHKAKLNYLTPTLSTQPCSFTFTVSLAQNWDKLSYFCMIMIPMKVSHSPDSSPPTNYLYSVKMINHFFFFCLRIQGSISSWALNKLLELDNS